MYIVGADAATSLLETGLITSTAQHDDSSTMCFKGEELIVPEIIAAMGQRLGKANRITCFKYFREAVDLGKLGEIKGMWLCNNTSKHPLKEEQSNLIAELLGVHALGEEVILSGASSEKFENLSFLHIESCITQLLVKLELPSSLLATKVMKQSDDMVSEFLEIEEALQCCQLVKLHFSGYRKLCKLPEGFDRLHA
ncbi:hypothetical protein SUGI_0221830 [Cryptomeria japonica]|uniref:uncharacterized protein LOC131043390 n=1 Tax=Cryptomeria japonica TaxID=3369 RepID=UPI002408E69C|nr:uncharacterized protein LOC131043390 [Cryptomeria japonica]XP_057832565.2 uncharacterized protein LOC131043390 [Cryptomeria japonica]XP_057832566.2 uncharacterized protein LOC131043390 [Cryptomeria japonica]XP_059074109.1 uncharacterized protein LOC131043390 [Cryptomeria japonica]XP_059074110.1 uncharacterized protein LOC131043390 [Cryptomeria japonica]GLJ13884.1 hypothetical protein SUGI_0221830 [Cryptomeria japonica]